MRVENLEKAKELLIDAFIELENSMEDADSAEDGPVSEVLGYERQLQDIVGGLSLKIGFLKRKK